MITDTTRLRESVWAIDGIREVRLYYQNGDLEQPVIGVVGHRNGTEYSITEQTKNRASKDRWLVTNDDGTPFTARSLRGALRKAIEHDARVT